MSLVDLIVLYAIVGAGCAAVVYRRARGSTAKRLGSAAIALPLWPIWGPIALLPDAAPRSRATDRAERIEAELAQAVAAAERSPFEVLLPKAAADRIRAEVREALSRTAELDAVLEQPGFDRREAEARVVGLSAGGASKRALRTAVLHRDNVLRIEALRDKNVRALEELGELVGALRSQLVLARYAGSSPEGVGSIVTEMWARVESLGEVMEAQEASTGHDEGEGSTSLAP
ncbi:MAG: hypothetical protein KF729_37395 [Sandaracinaceae bacterium]|nr:hypothetical protein [Sandaracinaceae bacterium]